MPKHAPNVPKGTPSDRSDERIGLTEAFSPVGDGAHAGGFSYRGDNEDEYPDAIEALEPVDAPPLLFGDEAVPVEPEEPQGRHGKKKKEKKQKQQIPAYQRKSRRMRRVLIAIVVLLVLLIGALGYFAWQWFEESQLIASQQTQEQQSSQEVGSMQTDETKDATTATAKKTDVPDLAAVLGMTKDEAITALKHGATETTSKEVNEEGNPVKTNVTVALTDEPADTSRIAGLDLIYKAAVDLLHDLIDTGEQPGEQVNGPLLQSLGHNGMIGVGTGLCGNIPCFLPGQSLFIQKDTHQLRDRNRRMGII